MTTTSASRKAELAEKRRYWQQHLEAWRASGLTQLDYCRQHDLSRHRFQYWKKRFQNSGHLPAFIELTFSGRSLPGSTSPPLRLVMDNHYQIAVERNFDPVALKQLMGVLSRL